MQGAFTNVSAEFFARIVIYPNHFDTKKNKISYTCFAPRPKEEGISIIKCNEIELTALIARGETIIANQKSPEVFFYGCVFILRDIFDNHFSLFQNGKDKNHYLIKHKEIDYKQPFPSNNILIMRQHFDLVIKSIIITKDELNILVDTTNYWELIYNRAKEHFLKLS